MPSHWLTFIECGNFRLGSPWIRSLVVSLPDLSASSLVTALPLVFFRHTYQHTPITALSYPDRRS